MPAKFDVKMTRDALYKCFPEEIEARADLNGRQEKPNIEWLIADILRHGQLEPVLIWNDGGSAVLAAGFSRWRAISEINKRKLTQNKLQIKCVYINCNEQSAFIRNLSENRMRNPTTPIDDAHNIQKLFDWTMDEKQVAQIYFPIAATDDEVKDAIKWIRERVNLIRLTPEAERAMRDGRLNETAAQAISKLSGAQQKELIKNNDGKINAKDIKAAAPKNNRGRKPGEVKPVPIDAELRRRITGLVESANWELFEENPDLIDVSMIEVQAEKLAALKNYIAEN